MKCYKKQHKTAVMTETRKKLKGKNSPRIHHVRRRDRSRLPNAVIKYLPAGKRNLDCYIETRADHKVKVPESIMMMMMTMVTVVKQCIGLWDALLHKYGMTVT
jgi:hypothetical protein